MTNSKINCLKQAVALSVAALMILVTTPPLSHAASHREAPLIALDPAADNTTRTRFAVGRIPGK